MTSDINKHVTLKSGAGVCHHGVHHRLSMTWIGTVSSTGNVLGNCEGRNSKFCVLAGILAYVG